MVASLMDPSTESSSPWRFDDAALRRIGSDAAKAYRIAAPFPHVVLDGLFKPALISSLMLSFPSPADPAWRRSANPLERKLSMDREQDLPASAVAAIDACNSRPFLEFLTQVTGIGGLIADPYLLGGGLHQIEPGGLLSIHADFNHHPIMHVDRRINLLLYLNDRWEASWGGALELWDRQMKAAVTTVQPIAGRCVIFGTTDFTYHGHPEPLACPAGMTRRSLALYYYSNGRPAGEVDPTRNNTRFVPRPGDAWQPPRASWKSRALRWTPPALAEMARRTRDRVVSQ